MGGLAGFIGPTGVFDAAEMAKKMLDPVMPRRGTETTTLRLGASSVSIVNGHDSCIDGDHSLIVAVHGSVDNVDALSRKYTAVGRTNPAAVIRESLSQTSPQSLARELRGAFTIVCSDGQTMWLIRDHVGVRPVFMHNDGQRWAVATEAKQLLPLQSRSEPNLEYLRELLFGGNSEATVALKGIDRAPRASVTTLIPGNTAHAARYWDPTEIVETSDIRDPQEAAEILRELIATAVERTITGNDALALSGGLDSTTIAAFASGAHSARANGRPLKAVSAVYPHHPSVDESELIALVADAEGLESHTFELQSKPLDDLDMWVGLLDGPGYTPSVPEIREMYQVAADTGATTILTGELAEYLFAMRYQTLGHLVWNRRWSAVGRHLRYERSTDRSWASIARELIRSLAPSPILHEWSSRRAGVNAPPWVSASALPWLKDRDRIPAVAKRWPTIQLQPITGDHAVSFDDVDIASSIPNISVRHPLVDRDLWEFVLSLRAEVKYPTTRTKQLMRMAVDGRLPDEIVYRQNKTFFDEAGQEKTDYEELKKWVSTGSHRFEGVDYDLLKRRLSSSDLGLIELDWVKSLARCHAFLAQFD